jgi:hypothetical protein
MPQKVGAEYIQKKYSDVNIVIVHLWNGRELVYKDIILLTIQKDGQFMYCGS